MARKRSKRDPLLTKEQQAQMDAFKALQARQRAQVAQALQSGTALETTLVLAVGMDGTRLDSKPATPPEAKPARRRKPGKKSYLPDGTFDEGHVAAEGTPEQRKRFAREHKRLKADFGGPIPPGMLANVWEDILEDTAENTATEPPPQTPQSKRSSQQSKKPQSIWTIRN